MYQVRIRAGENFFSEISFNEEMNQMENKKNKKINNNNSSNSLVFGWWPQTKIGNTGNQTRGSWVRKQVSQPLRSFRQNPESIFSGHPDELLMDRWKSPISKLCRTDELSSAEMSRFEFRSVTQVSGEKSQLGAETNRQMTIDRSVE